MAAFCLCSFSPFRYHLLIQPFLLEITSWSGTPRNYFQCTPYVEDLDITESTLDVYAFGSVAIESPYLQNAVAAAQKNNGSLWRLPRLDPKVFVSDIFTDNTKDTYKFTNFSWLSHIYGVQILTQDLKSNSRQSDEVAFEGTLAHELYHCMKRRLHGYLGLTYSSISHNISKW